MPDRSELREGRRQVRPAGERLGRSGAGHLGNHRNRTECRWEAEASYSPVGRRAKRPALPALVTGFDHVCTLCLGAAQPPRGGEGSSPSRFRRPPPLARRATAPDALGASATRRRCHRARGRSEHIRPAASQEAASASASTVRREHDSRGGRSVAASTEEERAEHSASVTSRALPMNARDDIFRADHEELEQPPHPAAISSVCSHG